MGPKKSFPAWMAVLSRRLAGPAAVAFCSAAQAAMIVQDVPTTVVPPHLSDGTYLFGITVGLAPGQFLLPVRISGAVDLQSWQWDLHFDPAVVDVIDPGDGTAGRFGAQFMPGDASTLSFILGGFSAPGLLDDVAGSYPSLLTGPSGDGVLAYVLFAFLPGQENGEPGFRIDDRSPPSIPEPGTGALLVAAWVALRFQRSFDKRGDRS